MKKILLAFVSTAMLCGCSINEKKIAYAENSNNCSISSLKSDAALSKEVTLKDDPMGLAVKARNSKDVLSTLQDYSSKNKCMLSVISINELTKGLLKTNSIPGLKSQKDLGYFVLDSKKKEAMDTLGLKLPIHTLEPK